MSGEIGLKVLPNKAVFPVTQEQQLAYVLVEVSPAANVVGLQMPLNFGLVLDHSGSMEGRKIESLRTAANLAVDRMSLQDRLSVVIFDDSVKVLVANQTVGGVREIQQKIESIRADGGTKISLGLQSGLDELAKSLGTGAVSRLVLLTDGQTFGDEAECRSLAGKAMGLGIPIVALGLGEDWNEQLLDEIAALSGGFSDFIPVDRPENILRAFQKQVRDAQAAVIQDATLVLRLVLGVIPRAVWRVTPMITKLGHQALSDRDVQVSLGTLSNSQPQSILIELLVSPHQAGSYRLAQAEITYDVASLGLAGEKAKSDIILEFSPDPVRTSLGDPDVLNIVEKVTAHKLQTQAFDQAAMGNVSGATQKLRAAATRLLSLGEEDLAQTALEEAQRLEQGEGFSSHGTKKLRYETRKLTQKLED